MVAQASEIMGKCEDEIIGSSVNGIIRKRNNGNLECKRFFKSLKTDMKVPPPYLLIHTFIHPLMIHIGNGYRLQAMDNRSKYFNSPINIIS